jgi:putative ABC transport system permease protein
MLVMKALDSPIIDLPLHRLSLCFGLVLLVAIILLIWRSATHRDIYIATLRMTIQLALAAWVLAFLFQMNQARWTLLAILVMWLVASRVALRPLRQGRRSLYPVSVFSLGIGAGLTLFVIAYWVLQPDPWYSPRYLIPIAGMIFVNGMNGISMACDRLVAEMTHRSHEISREIESGKSVWEAALPSLRVSFQAALIPSINTMMVIGIVAIPGMMTGQILSGTAPGIAVKYQLMVMCMLLSSIGISTPLFLALSYRRYLPTESCDREKTHP